MCFGAALDSRLLVLLRRRLLVDRENDFARIMKSPRLGLLVLPSLPKCRVNCRDQLLGVGTSNFFRDLRDGRKMPPKESIRSNQAQTSLRCRGQNAGDNTDGVMDSHGDPRVILGHHSKYCGIRAYGCEDLIGGSVGLQHGPQVIPGRSPKSLPNLDLFIPRFNDDPNS